VTRRVLQARYIVPLREDPLEDGVIVIEHGRIQAVRARRRGEAVESLGNTAIIPPVVNAHAHLEFSDVTAPLGEPAGLFPDWIRAVVARRRAAEQIAGFESKRDQAVALGLAQTQAAGITAVGEIATKPWSYAPWRDASVAGVLFLELIGFDPERVPDLVGAAEEHLRDAKEFNSCHRVGVSPHAPYTVSPDLVSAICRLSGVEKFPVAMHLAETREELQLLNNQSGPFRDLLEDFGVWKPNVLHRGGRPLDYLKRLATADSALVVHGNYLSEEEMAFVAKRRNTMTVVYCPRTHAYFGHDPYPLKALVQQGTKVALGTDSRASNPDLDLWSEAKFAKAAHPQVSAKDILRMATHHGAEALALTTHQLLLGSSANYSLVELPNEESADPHELLLHETAELAHSPD